MRVCVFATLHMCMYDGIEITTHSNKGKQLAAFSDFINNKMTPSCKHTQKWKLGSLYRDEPN